MIVYNLKFADHYRNKYFTEKQFILYLDILQYYNTIFYFCAFKSLTTTVISLFGKIGLVFY